MNRNTESHFAEMPEADIKRSRFDRSHSFKFTGNAGDLIPFLCEECLPGDTFDITTSKVLRLQTLISPIMDNIYLDVFYFFVPLRLIWDHAKEFFGENTASAWLPQVTYQIPQIRFDFANKKVKVNSVLDYLGIPPSEFREPPFITTEYTVSALPLRAYNLVWNEWFRDQNYMDPVNLYTGDATVDVDPDDPVKGGPCQKVSRFHDYFSSCTPQAQKGNPVQFVQAPYTVPVRASATVYNGGQDALQWQVVGSTDTPRKTGTYNNTPSSTTYPTLFVSASPTNAIFPSNLVAQGIQLSGNTINELRLAFQTQKFLEKNLNGTRYREVILNHFGVRSPDARMQVPEYLGGNRIPIQVQQIVNSAATASEPLGNLGAMSNTTDIHDDVFKSFTEHGYLLGLCCLRYENSFSQGVERHWFRKNLYDYYWPVFSQIGNQPVYTKELFIFGSSATLNSTVWGYNEAWADYRFKTNRTAGEMRPYVPNSLTSWTLADDYAEQPTMSEDWLYTDKTNLDRVLAVTSDTSNQFFADFYIKNLVTRPMPMYSIPGFVDHF